MSLSSATGFAVFMFCFVCRNLVIVQFSEVKKVQDNETLGEKMGHWLRKWTWEGHSRTLATLTQLSWVMSSFTWVPTRNMVCFLIQSLIRGMSWPWDIHASTKKFEAFVRCPWQCLEPAELVSQTCRDNAFHPEIHKPQRSFQVAR